MKIYHLNIDNKHINILNKKNKNNKWEVNKLYNKNSFFILEKHKTYSKIVYIAHCYLEAKNLKITKEGEKRNFKFKNNLLYIDKNIELTHNNNFINTEISKIINKIKNFNSDNIYYNSYKIGQYFNVENNSKNKLKYQIFLYKNHNIKIVCNNKIYNIKKYLIEEENILRIYELSNNKNEVYINDIFILTISTIIDIKLAKNNKYKCSINIPISFDNTSLECLINFDFNIKKYLKHKNIQLNILHTDNDNNILDNLVISNKINYIYVKNPYNFNLGYTRNLYKYLNLSKYVYYSDIDIYTTEKQLNTMLEQINDYDIVKPYNRLLYNLSKEEKYEYIVTQDISIINKNITKTKLYSISGGNTLFREQILKDCGGYEELNCYGNEDRFMDVILLEKKYKVFKNNFDMYHLWHDKTFLNDIKKWNYLNKKALNYNKKYYNCTFNENNKNDMHENCNHITKYIDDIIKHKKKYNFNLNLFNNNKYINNIIMKPELNINKDKILFIMGNGPSLKEIMDNPEYLNILRNNDTFGLNAAYRAYEKYNFYPTYFGCFDYVVNESHKDQFEKLVLEDNPIKEFYFIGNDKKKQELYNKKVIDNDKFKKFNFINVGLDDFNKISDNFEEYFNPGSSGANALQIGIMKGYKKIVLLGCDCNYVEEVEGVKYYDKNSKYRLEMTKNVENNPNYWFSDYQKKGDRFNLPNTDKFQMLSWRNMSKFCPDDVEIINCSMTSKIPYFLKKYFYSINYKNLILVCSDYKYYNALLILLNSIIDYDNSHDLVMIFDVGLTKEQKDFISKIKLNLQIIDILPHLKSYDLELNLENVFLNINNYGFKPYILKNFDKFLPVSYKKKNINILFIDSGFLINKSLDDIFDKINTKHFFITDHNDCFKIVTFKNGNIDKLRIGTLSNILPPSVYKIFREDKINLKKEDLKEQYIKAGLVGYKYCGNYQFIIDRNLEYFYKSKIWSLEFYNKKDNEKYFYNKLFNDNDVLLTWPGSHRYDQTILSIFVNIYKLKEDALNYSYVVGQKQSIISLLIYLLNHVINNYELQDRFNYKNENKKFKYTFNQLGVGAQIAKYFCSNLDPDLEIEIFSENDLFWSHVKILNRKKVISELQLKNVYYYLFKTFIKKYSEKKKFLENNVHIKYSINDIIKPLEKHFILHRGLYPFNYSIFNKIKKNDKKLFILGNGPSLKKIMDDPKKLDILRNNDTFGLNAAYRAYKKYNFYPTYFGCFDYIVNKSHKNNFEKIVLENNNIKEFFFIGDNKNKQNLFSEEVKNNKRFTKLNFITRTPEEKKRYDILAYDFNHFTDMLTSGTNSVQVGILKGYKEIILLGCDCNYTEVINGAKVIDNKGKIIIEKNINKNPNYWFDEYQQKGDEFNIPNTNGCQLPAWNRLYQTIKNLKLNINIININDHSKIKCFKTQSPDEFFS